MKGSRWRINLDLIRSFQDEKVLSLSLSLFSFLFIRVASVRLSSKFLHKIVLYFFFI